MELINNRYEIVTLIGEGGMANVYLANDLVANKQVAIKILRGELAGDSVALVRFQREANAAATLAHPNIISIFDVGNDNNRHYIVMEYVKGRSLKQWISQRGALPLNEAIYIMQQVTLAIQVAHEKGIIHRDIKPQNILITDDGRIKITDFGIAMAQDALQLTVSDSVMGSVHYLSPELAKGGQATFQSDIYSLGIVFYELLSGQLPYRGETPIQVALMHLRDPMPMIRDLNPTVPQFIENIIIKMTAKNKDNRYMNCAELLYDLDRCKSVEAKERLVFSEPKASDDKTVTSPTLSKRSAKKNEKKKKDEDYYLDDDEDDGKKALWGKILIGGLLTLISIGAVVGVLFISGILKPPKKIVTLPDLSGVAFENAKTILEDLGVYVDPNVVYELTDNIEKDFIVSMVPAAGSEVEVGSSVKFIVSLGMWQIMPDYFGIDVELARQDLINRQMTNVTVLTSCRYDPKLEENTIVEQNSLSPDDKLDPNRNYAVSFVIICYRTGLIPNLKDISLEEAKIQLDNLGFKYKLSTLPIPKDEHGNELIVTRNVVVRTSPEMGATYTQTDKSVVTIFYYP